MKGTAVSFLFSLGSRTLGEVSYYVVRTFRQPYGEGSTYSHHKPAVYVKGPS